MNIGQFLKQSLVDYPGHVASVVFTQGCNFRCPFCHNGHLLPFSNGKVDEKEVLDYIKKNMLIDGVCITGGEPTLQPDLPQFIDEIKRCGLDVKLDTNGSNPEMLEDLLRSKKIDYVAMDVKAPLDADHYSKLIGRDATSLIHHIQRSIELISTYIKEDAFEFRTTYVPALLTKEDVVQICASLPKNATFVIQQFTPKHALSPEIRTTRKANEEEIDEILARCEGLVRKIEKRIYE